MNQNRCLKIAVIGCVEFSAHALKTLIDNPNCDIALVITRESSKVNSDFFDLSGLANAHNIPHIYVEGADQSKMIQALSASSVDILFCVGWSYLLKKEVFTLPRYGSVGYHPADLPHNRGRHPLIWALALGLEKTASTFFCLEEGADSGKILSKRDILILKNDYARDLYDTMLNVTKEQLHHLIDNWYDLYKNASPQAIDVGNIWRKRGKSDGKIDWRMSADNIKNLVRSLSRPYPGAHFEMEGKEIKVWRADVVHNTPSNIEPGKVIDAEHQCPIIQCGKDAIKLIEFDPKLTLSEGAYL